MKIQEPAMQFADEMKGQWEEGLSKNQDPYGNAVYKFASEWATGMEKSIASGESIEECARRVSHEVDDEGITGYMYGAAASMLSVLWVHGEDLRIWHNIDTQIGDEGEKANESGGVLNPAIMSLNTK